MRESIGGTWITQLVIVFMFVFIAFLALSINYSKAFRVKNEVLSIIEKREGMNQNTIQLINNYLKNNGYTYRGSCDNGTYGVNIANNIIEEAVTNRRYNYCVGREQSVAVNYPDRSFYNVKLFFKFNLPVVGDIYTFSVDGQTKDVNYPKGNLRTEHDIINGIR